MRRTTLQVSLVALVATAAVDHPFPISALTPARAQAPAEPATTQENPATTDEAPPEPPTPETAPAPAPVQVPVVAPVPPPPAVIPVTIPPTEYASPHQGVYGPVLRVQPAHRIAMMEAGRELPETDPLVARAATVLTGLTARFVEDAPRIVDLTIKTTAAIRTAKGAASPLELMEAALNSKRPAGSLAVGPRRFNAFVTRYRESAIGSQRDAAPAPKPR